ncbi:MAG: enoyl-CoA hydratase/isomerase family protein [Acidimicrobiales bacterium]
MATEHSYEQIRYEVRGAAALVTLDRPDKLNAWTPKMGRELLDAFAEANRDRAVGAIVVTGAGRGFCAGADIGGQFKAQLDRSDAAPRERAAPDTRAATAWVDAVRAAKPLVAAINGACIGVGLTMVLGFDHLVASAEAKLSCRFIKMGITPELASSHYLVARMGWGAASDLALTGRTIDAEEALALRLVDRVVPAEELLDAALAKAEQFAENPDPQLRAIKALLTQNAFETDLEAVQARELAALAEAFTTPEHREAVAAFLEKRPPKFR